MLGFINLIKRLNNQCSIGLVTASPEYMFKWIDKRLNLGGIFKYVVFMGA